MYYQLMVHFKNLIKKHFCLIFFFFISFAIPFLFLSMHSSIRSSGERNQVSHFFVKEKKEYHKKANFLTPSCPALYFWTKKFENLAWILRCLLP